MPDRMGRVAPGSGELEELYELVVAAVEEGLLPRDVQAPEVRSYLRRKQGACTPIQARGVVARLRPETGPRNASGPEAPPPATFGDRLAYARKALYLSQADLASRVGRSTSYISLLEAGSRKPSEELLHLLATAVGKEPEWLRTGNASQITRRIADLLRFATYAVQQGDADEAEQCLHQLDEDLGRPLRTDEADRADFVRARVDVLRGRLRQAADRLAPLVRRSVSGDCHLPAVELGQRYLGSMIDASVQDEVHVEDVLDAATVIQQVLGSVEPARRDDQWWRLAATVMGVQMDNGSPRASLAQGEAWLAEIGPADDSHPSGVAAINWNLCAVKMELGQIDEALAHMETAARLHDGNRFPEDGARVQLTLAAVLMVARPHRVEEAVTILDRCHADIRKWCPPLEEKLWTIERARADLIAGRSAAAERRVGPLATAPRSPTDQVHVSAWTLVGDAQAARGRATAAHEAYAEAMQRLRKANPHYGQARTWRNLGDRLVRLGRSDAAVDAYRHALDAANVRQMPGLPPFAGDVQVE